MVGEIGRRRVRPRGFYYDFLFGTGFIRTFQPDKTYTVGDDNSVKKVFMPGQLGFAPTLAITFGKSYWQKTTISVFMVHKT